jgi:hypothetical protein
MWMIFWKALPSNSVGQGGSGSLFDLLAIHVAPVQQACRGGDAQGRWGSAQEHRAGGTPVAACELGCFNPTT